MTMLKVSSGRIQCRQRGFHHFPSEVNLESSVSFYVLTAAMTGACLTVAVKEKKTLSLFAHVTFYKYTNISAYHIKFLHLVSTESFKMVEIMTNNHH